MLPLKDDVPSRGFPLVTVVLIALNAAVFLYQASLAMGPEPGAAGAAQAFGGDERLALAGWYQGERAVRKHGAYGITKPFVANVLALRSRM